MKSYHSIVVPIRLAVAVSRMACNRSRSVLAGVAPASGCWAMCFPLSLGRRWFPYWLPFTSAAPAASACSLPSAARRDNGNMPQSVQA